jgi:hypothetical protein
MAMACACTVEVGRGAVALREMARGVCCGPAIAADVGEVAEPTGCSAVVLSLQ